MPPDIFYYLKPDEVVKLILDGVNKDIQFLDLIFLFEIIITAYFLLSYIPISKLKKSSKNKSKDLDNNDIFEIDIFGFKINRRQIIYVAILATLIHLSKGIMIRSKTNLIVEISNNCDTGSLRFQANHQSISDTSKFFLENNSSELVKKSIAENYAFQSLSNSLLFQIFNYEKMYITRKEDPFNSSKLLDYFVLSIPLLLFTLFFLIVGYEWIIKANGGSGDTLSFRSKIFRYGAVVLIYSINFYSFYLWIWGIRDVAKLVGFGYNILGT